MTEKEVQEDEISGVGGRKEGGEEGTGDREVQGEQEEQKEEEVE